MVVGALQCLVERFAKLDHAIDDTPIGQTAHIAVVDIEVAESRRSQSLDSEFMLRLTDFLRFLEALESQFCQLQTV